MLGTPTQAVASSSSESPFLSSPLRERRVFLIPFKPFLKQIQPRSEILLLHHLVCQLQPLLLLRNPRKVLTPWR